MLHAGTQHREVEAGDRRQVGLEVSIGVGRAREHPHRQAQPNICRFREHPTTVRRGRRADLDAAAVGTYGTQMANHPEESLIVRDAVVGDVPAVIHLLQQLNLGNEAREGNPDDAVYREAFAAIDADPRQSLLVAVVGAEVVGTATLVNIPNLSHGGRTVAQIESVVVSTGHRGHGIGEALVDECLRRARAAGCFRAQLTSNAARVAAHRFWEQQGFTASHVGFKRSL